MDIYRVGFIYVRCFLQKSVGLADGIDLVPLLPTGFAGGIHDGRRLFDLAKFPFSRDDLNKTLDNFKACGPSVLVSFEKIRAKTFELAIESQFANAENAIGAVSIVSQNPAVPLCAFAQGTRDSGVKYFVPNDTIIRHGTNVPGPFDALSDIHTSANSNPKLALLIRLFRASLREYEVDNQLLFQLILFEEASDDSGGTSLAERLRNFSEGIGFSGDLNAIAARCGVELPDGKDVIDLIVKLRNAAAHNGKIDSESLHQYNADWAIPILEQKEKLHKLMIEASQYMFCCMVGHTRDAKAIKVTGPLEIRFD